MGWCLPEERLGQLSRHLAVYIVVFITTSQPLLFVFQSLWQQDRINNNEFSVRIIHNQNKNVYHVLWAPGIL